MANYEMSKVDIDFELAISDVTGGNKKVKKNEYLIDGEYPIIDQGKELIAGYTNNKNNLYKFDLPIIVFGDHTRILKFIDFPFCLGADGVKALLPNKVFDVKYLYYFFNTLNIQSRGYSRHFKFLKKFSVPLISKTEQKRIVEILDQAEEIRQLRKQADEKSNEIISSLFYNMFGDPSQNNIAWPTIEDFTSKVTKRNSNNYDNTTFNYIDIAGINGTNGQIESYKKIESVNAPSRARQIIKSNDVLISTVRPYLRATAIVPKDLNNQICSTGFCVLRSKFDYGYGFLYGLSRISWFSQYLMSKTRGANYPAVSDSDIKEIRVPFPLEKPETLVKYDSVVDKLLDISKLKLNASESIQNLYDNLLSKAFDGSLTANWREGRMKELLQEMEEQKKYLGIN